MNLGNQVEWALHCMAILASMPEGVNVPAKVLAEFHGVPKEYLSKSLQLLSQEGLLKTTLGPTGGYQLAKPADQITFLEIVEAVEGRKKTFNCTEIRGNNPCLKKSEKKPAWICQIASVMYEADKAWRLALEDKRLSDVNAQLVKEIDPKILERTANWFKERL